MASTGGLPYSLDSNVRIRATGEVLTGWMANSILAMYQSGLAVRSIPHRFDEMWDRELDRQTMAGSIVNDAEYTSVPVTSGLYYLSGRRLDPVTSLPGSPMEISYPRGLIYWIFRQVEYHGGTEDSIFRDLGDPNDRFAALWVYKPHFARRTIRTIISHWNDIRVTFDAHGNSVLRDIPEPHQHIGHRIGELPVSPSERYDRIPYGAPPPTYSPPRPNGHPNAVLVPLELLERPSWNRFVQSQRLPNYLDVLTHRYSPPRYFNAEEQVRRDDRNLLEDGVDEPVSDDDRPFPRRNSNGDPGDFYHDGGISSSTSTESFGRSDESSDSNDSLGPHEDSRDWHAVLELVLGWAVECAQRTLDSVQRWRQETADGRQSNRGRPAGPR